MRRAYGVYDEHLSLSFDQDLGDVLCARPSRGNRAQCRAAGALVGEPCLTEALGSDTVRRIAIIGTGGAGKTTLARELGRRLGLPVVHLDRVFWRPGWTEPPPEEWQRAHRAALTGEAWIADGNYGSTMAERIALADTVIVLDPPPLVCVGRVASRQLRWLGRARDDLPPGCVEHLRPRETLAFWHYIWRYRRDKLPGVLARIESAGPGKRVVILRTRTDVARLLASTHAVQGSSNES
jgi:adenylate kinase family enzyme